MCTIEGLALFKWLLCPSRTTSISPAIPHHNNNSTPSQPNTVDQITHTNKPNFTRLHKHTKMSSNDNTSTLQAAVDSVTGTVQSVIGSVTGSTGDKAQGEAKQDKAQAENDASHTAVKVPGATVSSSGVATDHQDRTAGSWNQTVGSAKETVGGLIGSEVSPTLPFRRGASKGMCVCVHRLLTPLCP